jgi:trimethylamine---corrinoid protein Co-methyltransferase
VSEGRGERRGRAARQAARLAASIERVPFLTRSLEPVEVLSEEGLALLELNADRILEEVGIEFREAPDALELLRAAGADVQHERVRFPRGMCRSIVQATAPRQFTQAARNRANDVVFGGSGTIFAPAYGSPFVRDLDNGRRNGTIEDFRSSFEQWEAEGGQDADVRANTAWNRALASYEAPSIDEAVDEELREWIDRRKASVADSNV